MLTHSTVITVKGTIFGTPVTMLVDTGSAVTIVGERVWKLACGNTYHIEEPPSSPIVTANGDPLVLLGRSEASLSIGGLDIRYPVLVARDLVQECILGADFLECFKCVVNIEKKILTVSGTSVPLELVRTDSPTSCHVMSTKTITVPGRSQMEIPAKFSDTNLNRCLGDQTYLLVPKEEFMERQKVVIAHSIHSISPAQLSITVRILNPCLENATIHTNQNIGIFDPVLHVGEICHSRQQTNDTPKEIVEEMGSNTNLAGSDRLAFKQLLNEYSDIISLHSSDLGKTEVVKHSINTGHAQPIKQPTRRLPFHHKQLVKSMLDDMHQRGVIEPSSSPWSAPNVEYYRTFLATRRNHPLMRI